MNEKDLLKIKDDIEETRTELSELKGKRNHLIEQLKKDWNCESIAEAKEKLEEIEEEIWQLDEQIKEGVKEIKEGYDV